MRPSLGKGKTLRRRLLKKKITACPHLARVDVGSGQRASAQECGDLEGVNPIVLGFAAVDRLHIQRETEYEDPIFLATEISEPVLAEEALDRDDQVVAAGRDGLEKSFAVAVGVPVDQDLVRLVEASDVHGSGVEVDTTVGAVVSGVESHRGLVSYRSLATRRRRKYKLVQPHCG